MTDTVKMWESDTISLQESMSPPYPCILYGPFSGRMWFQIEIYEREYEENVCLTYSPRINSGDSRIKREQLGLRQV